MICYIVSNSLVLVINQGHQTADVCVRACVRTRMIFFKIVHSLTTILKLLYYNQSYIIPVRSIILDNLITTVHLQDYGEKRSRKLKVALFETFPMCTSNI